MINRQRGASAGVLGAMVICSLALSQQLMAQQAPQATNPPPPQGQAPAKDNPEGKTNPPAPDPNKRQNDRLFYALPNYLTVENASSLPPQTAKEKFKTEALSTFDPVEYPFIAVVAGINQASNSEAAFGQGFRGYAKRYGTAFGDTMVGNFMTGAVFPSLLRQDARYYQLGKGRVLHRIVYAGCRVFITRSDSGQKQFNFSELLGNGVAAGIANAYHPPPRTLENTVSIWWTSVGWDAAAYELKEFWPDLKRKLHKQ
jgi:hypothetical protein